MKQKWMVWALGILSVVALTFSLYGRWVRQPELQMPEPSPSGGANVETNPETSPATSPGLEWTLPEESEPALLSGDRKEGVYTILVVGTSDNYSTDTIMVLALDVPNRSVSLVSIPRDTKVNAPRALKKINGAYGAGGTDLLKKEIGSILGFAPDFSVKVELEGFVALVDEIGGIEFDVPQRMDYDDPTQDLHIHFKPGLQHLDGQKAMELLRFRGYIGADIRRMQTQQEFLKAVAKKLLLPANLGNIPDLARIYAENVETDLTVGNLIWFGLRFREMAEEDFQTYTLPTYTADVSVNPLYYQFVSTSAAIELINEVLNPFNQPITRANVKHPQFVAPTSSEVIVHSADAAP